MIGTVMMAFLMTSFMDAGYARSLQKDHPIGLILKGLGPLHKLS